MTHSFDKHNGYIFDEDYSMGEVKSSLGFIPCESGVVEESLVGKK